MSSLPFVSTKAAGKIAQLYVFNELLKRDAAVYIPLVDEGVDALVRTTAGRTIEIQVKSSEALAGNTPGGSR